MIWRAIARLKKMRMRRVRNTKSLSVNNSALRYRPKAMAARHEPPPNVVHWARVVTPQTRFGAVTLRAGGDLNALLCRKKACDTLPRSGRLREQASRALPANGRLRRERVRARPVVNGTTARLASRAASQIARGAGLNYLRTSSKSLDRVCVSFSNP